MVRKFVERCVAAAYTLIFVGRIKGKSFILRTPTLLKVSKGSLLEIGKSTFIDVHARIVVHGRLQISDRVFIGKNSTLVSFDSLVIGSGTIIAENVSIHTENHGPSHDRNAYTSKPISIGKNVWIGAGAVVLSGVSIGDNATIGANAVVTRDVEANATAVGVPARVISAAQTEPIQRASDR